MTATTSRSPADEHGEKPRFQPQNYLFLIPTVTAIALGILFVPYFGIGLAAGAGMVVAHVIIDKMLTACGAIEDSKEKTSKYSREIHATPYNTAVIAPIVEEALFRGGMQPALSEAIRHIVPATSAALFGPLFSIATTVSIVTSGIIFGAIHYLNPHQAALQQAVAASAKGIALGILAVQFGFGVAVAAHLANNTIATIVMMGQPSDKSPPTHPYNEFRNSPLPA